MTPTVSRSPREPWMAAGGHRLRVLRCEAGLTSDALAARAGIARSTLSAIERGVAQPSYETRRRLAAALELDADVLTAAYYGAAQS